MNLFSFFRGLHTLLDTKLECMKIRCFCWTAHLHLVKQDHSSWITICENFSWARALKCKEVVLFFLSFTTLIILSWPELLTAIWLEDFSALSFTTEVSLQKCMRKANICCSLNPEWWQEMCPWISELVQRRVKESLPCWCLRFKCF